MNLGIYKPGQGYWVRVMTAVLVALVTILLAWWINEQGKALAEFLPKNTWNAAVDLASGSVTPGGTVDLSARPNESGQSPVIGTAVLEAYNADARLATFGSIKMNEGRQPSEIAAAAPLASGTAPAFSLKLSRPQGQQAIQPAILGGSMAIGVVVIGAILGYWFVGLREKTVEFLIATDFEMKKVHWTSWREVLGNTWVVIGACILLALCLWLIDLGLSRGFHAIGLI